jgi:hypothetical protein
MEMQAPSREGLLAAISARLERAGAIGDLSPVLEPGASDELCQLAGLIDRDPEDVLARFTLGWMHWYRHQARAAGENHVELNAAIATLAPCFVVGTDGLPADLLPLLAEQSVAIADDILSCAEDNGADWAVASLAVTAWQRIVAALPDSHPDRAKHLYQTGIALHTRFALTGILTDLNDAITAVQAAADATPESDASLARHLSALGKLLRIRYERTGAITDLEAAVDVGQTAVEATPLGNSPDPAALTNLATALRVRFERMGSLADLDAAIQAGQAAVGATPADAPRRASSLSGLGNSLLARFNRTESLTDLDAAIEAAQAAANATPGHDPNRAARLSNLAGALQYRFEKTKNPADLDAAIQAGQSAVDATPALHSRRAGRLSNLAGALAARFELTDSLTDLDAAIQVMRAAAGNAPGGHPGQAVLLLNLGLLLKDQFERTSRETDRNAAFSAFAAATEIAEAGPSLRIRAGRSAARLIAQSDPGRAADLLENAVRLLAEVAPGQLTRSDQQYAIGTFAGLASDAASLVLADTGGGSSSTERAARALGLLEAGRAVILSRALDTRDDLTDLRQKAPELAERFTRLRDHLDETVLQPDAPHYATDTGTAPGSRPDQRYGLAAQLAQVLAEIRSTDGFSSFGLPPDPEELLAQARTGPVITLNVSAYRSDAILLSQAGITSIELPSLTLDALRNQLLSFYRAVDTATTTGMWDAAAQHALSSVLEWLWDAAAEPVLTALSFNEPTSDDDKLPHVWWVPGGLLGALPLHAAGYHAELPPPGQPRRTVLDRVISSYTPTIRALRYARQHPRKEPSQALIVAMPVTPGLPPEAKLPGVPAEVADIRDILPHPVILAEPDADSSESLSGSAGVPTKARVLTLLPDFPIAHFACHGTCDPTDPSQSMLLLNDHQTEPFTVASLAPIKHDELQLVYLSACDTALSTGAGLLDEAIHLASAFLLAGSRHVIGTLWTINDAVAGQIAASFYHQLHDNGTLDPERAAAALHKAIRTVRDTFCEIPYLWAAHLHAGA